jgi:hypothetical protein
VSLPLYACSSSDIIVVIIIVVVRVITALVITIDLHAHHGG